jgi:hypothetical protein
MIEKKRCRPESLKRYNMTGLQEEARQKNINNVNQQTIRKQKKTTTTAITSVSTTAAVINIKKH